MKANPNLTLKFELCFKLILESASEPVQAMSSNLVEPRSYGSESGRGVLAAQHICIPNHYSTSGLKKYSYKMEIYF